LSYGNQIILSETGVQQGDILGPVLFCLALHPVIKSLKSEFNGTLLDDSSFRIAIALRTGQPVCEPHTCICGAPADIFGHHGLFVVKVLYVGFGFLSILKYILFLFKLKTKNILTCSDLIRTCSKTNQTQLLVCPKTDQN
jgi:hypothetical protein